MSLCLSSAVKALVQYKGLIKNMFVCPLYLFPVCWARTRAWKMSVPLFIVCLCVYVFYLSGYFIYPVGHYTVHHVASKINIYLFCSVLTREPPGHEEILTKRYKRNSQTLHWWLHPFVGIHQSTKMLVSILTAAYLCPTYLPSLWISTVGLRPWCADSRLSVGSSWAM